MKKFIYKNQNILFIFVISILSILFNFYYGYRGIFPIDSFLIFDSGYNVLQGSFPFKDYWTITGPFLDYFQALFFLIFGVSWFSYVLHASVINLILGLFSYFLFINFKLNNFFSFIYSTGIVLLAYPHIGTPFIDHHSTIFSVLAIYFFVLGVKNKNNIFIFFIPILLSFAFLSKQIPSVYIIIYLSFIFVLFFYYKRDLTIFYYIFYGFLFSLLIFLSVMIINKIPFNNFIIQYIFYPMSIGETRLENLNFSLKGFIFQFKYIYIFLLPLILIFLKITFKKNKNENEKIDLMIILLILGATLIFIYTQLLTRNQILIFFLIPMLAAFSHIYLINYFNKNYLIYILIIICLFSVTKYHFRYNEQKKFMDLSNVNLDLAVKGESIDPLFKRVKWITPFYPDNPSKEVKNLVEIKEYINKNKDKKIIISDYQFLSAISNLKISSPNKWYDDMSVPSQKNKYFYFYKDFFINSLKKNDIKNIYVVGTDKHLYFMDFFDNSSCIKSRAINEMFVIYDINECDLQ